MITLTQQTLDTMVVSERYKISEEIIDLRNSLTVLESNVYSIVVPESIDHIDPEMKRSIDIGKLASVLLILANTLDLYIDRVNVGMRGLASISVISGQQVSEMSSLVVRSGNNSPVHMKTPSRGIKRTASAMDISPCASPELTHCMKLIAETGKTLTHCTLMYSRSRGLYNTLKVLKARVNVMHQHCTTTS